MDPMMIRITQKEGPVIAGKIWHACLDHPAEFAGVGQLILRMEEICDREGLVLMEEEPRFLNEGMRRRHYHKRKQQSMEKPASEPLAFLDDQELHSGKTKVLLVVNVRSRRNHTMQGTVWGPLTKGMYVGFRSALELMRMIDLIEA